MASLSAWLDIAVQQDVNSLVELQKELARDHPAVSFTPDQLRTWLWTEQQICLNPHTPDGRFIRPVKLSRED